VLSKWRRPAGDARSCAVRLAERASSQINAGPAGSPSASTSQVPSPWAVTAMAATRLPRFGTVSAKPLRLAAASAQVAAMSCSAPTP